jgi:hypothetical protein
MSFAVLAAACLITACAPAPDGRPILVSAPTTALVAVSSVGAGSVRILHVRGASIVLLRTVFMPQGERVQSVTWSSDECCAVIETSGKVLALDTRTWRLESRARVAVAARGPHAERTYERR